MGCDIHCYVEYKKPGNNNWSPFGGRINPGRYYGAFARMAGVGNYPEWGITPIAEPRGMPHDPAYEASRDNEFYVIDRRDDRSEERDGMVFRDTAERWVANGSSVWVEHNGRREWVTHPDWHSHSWLTADELEKCICEFNEASGYKALVACLRSFERQGCEARLVFWFDN